MEAIKEADACADRITAASKLEGASLEKVHNSEKDLSVSATCFWKSTITEKIICLESVGYTCCALFMIYSH